MIEYSKDWEHKVCIGIDECNFSPSICGDCVVAACWLPLHPRIYGIRDSKDLSHTQRAELFAKIAEYGLFSIAPANPTTISKLGIYTARNIAAQVALIGIEQQMDLGVIEHATDRVIISDSHLKKAMPEGWIDIGIVQAGRKSYVVAAASICAKIYVNSLFEGWEKNWPGYGMNSDHGSLSKLHREALRTLGPSPVHRRGIYAREWWKSILNKKEISDEDAKV